VGVGLVAEPIAGGGGEGRPGPLDAAPTRFAHGGGETPLLAFTLVAEQVELRFHVSIMPRGCDKET
jgi:hypothetical protein